MADAQKVLERVLGINAGQLGRIIILEEDLAEALARAEKAEKRVAELEQLLQDDPPAE